MLNLKHPRALARFIYAQRVTGLEPSHSIGLDDEARERFLAVLKRSQGYLEFGSGGSTFAAAEFGVRTLSVESDRFFAAAVRRALPTGVDIQILDIDLGLTREWSRPIFTSPTPSRLRRWRRYSSTPFDRLDNLGWFPDLVLVDGRFRRASAMQSAREALRKGQAITLIVDDYFYPDHSPYRSIEQWLGQPERIGRAALFDVRSDKSIQPDLKDIDEAARDYE
jgi:hypothetical protein